ncbi:class I SAM-dependent methyltransferase, partial [Lipingzhangella sp. LS1_29]
REGGLVLEQLGQHFVLALGHDGILRTGPIRSQRVIDIPHTQWSVPIPGQPGHLPRMLWVTALRRLGRQGRMMGTEPNNNAGGAATRRLRRRWDRMAPYYDRGARWERRLLGDARIRLCALAHGRVLDVAVGTGFNLDYLPADTTVTGIDLSAGMMQQARERAETLGREVQLGTADATRIPFSEDSFDTVICTLSLCEIPDQEHALREMRRVLRPEGSLLLMDHVEYTKIPLRWLEGLRSRIRGTPPRRRPLEIVREQGMHIDEYHRFALGLVDVLAARSPQSGQR